MDGLSVAASVAGLLQVTTKIIGFLSTMSDAPSLARHVQEQTAALTAIFHQLDDFITGAERPERKGRKAMIYVNQIVATLTGCVCAFSELEECLASVTISQRRGLTLWDRAKWAAKEGDIQRLLQNLEQHKSSLSLMLTIYNCESNKEAKRSMERVAELMEAILGSNPGLAARMCPRLTRARDEVDSSTLCSTSDAATIRSSKSVSTLGKLRASLFAFEFDRALQQTRVYAKARKDNPMRRPSFETLKTTHSMWSQLTELSLSQVSSIAVIHLPITAAELYNGTPYLNPLPEIMEVSQLPRVASNSGAGWTAERSGTLVNSTSPASEPNQSTTAFDSELGSVSIPADELADDLEAYIDNFQPKSFVNRESVLGQIEILRRLRSRTMLWRPGSLVLVRGQASDDSEQPRGFIRGLKKSQDHSRDALRAQVARDVVEAIGEAIRTNNTALFVPPEVQIERLPIPYRPPALTSFPEYINQRVKIRFPFQSEEDLSAPLPHIREPDDDDASSTFSFEVGDDTYGADVPPDNHPGNSSLKEHMHESGSPVEASFGYPDAACREALVGEAADGRSDDAQLYPDEHEYSHNGLRLCRPQCPAPLVSEAAPDLKLPAPYFEDEAEDVDDNHSSDHCSDDGHDDHDGPGHFESCIPDVLPSLELPESMDFHLGVLVKDLSGPIGEMFRDLLLMEAPPGQAIQPSEQLLEAETVKASASSEATNELIGDKKETSSHGRTDSGVAL
ncbi:hypothetical protein FN846DRAFT_183551 [Sphaerosporella brunnea]|uniref:Fungal N-terminal domain-containing protein n=1 Tax=Sphaerosporella brunnea TaxID=1250544 RepID=A0A5J5F8K5_9PEZI|nr:hypothetical protein FN846DRAFT_183551 [Sphaerosporella brunnea]